MDKNLKLISISGPPLAGKTTLWNDVGEALGAVADRVPDLPRIAVERLGAELIDQDLQSFQHYVGFAQLVREAAEAKGTLVRLLDKSLVDATAYWDILVGKAHPEWAKTLSKKRYALVVVCDHTEIRVPGDKMQKCHEALRDDLGARIAELARSAGRHMLFVSGSRDFRKRVLLDTLRELDLPH